jgi:hypothetical protein
MTDQITQEELARVLAKHQGRGNRGFCSDCVITPTSERCHLIERLALALQEARGPSFSTEIVLMQLGTKREELESELAASDKRTEDALALAGESIAYIAGLIGEIAAGKKMTINSQVREYIAALRSRLAALKAVE